MATLFRVRRQLMLLGILSVTLAVLCVASPGEAATDRSGPTATVFRPGAVSFAAGDLPGARDLPPIAEVSSGGGIVTLTQAAAARTSKMVINAGRSEAPLWAAFYNPVLNTPLDDPTSFQLPCRRGRACVDNPFYQPQCAIDGGERLAGQYFQTKIYPIMPFENGGAEVGVVARIRVNLVAFGSIPAIATLTIRVPRVAGKVQPLTAHVWDWSSASGPTPCDPDFVPPGATNVNGDLGKIDTLVEGRVSLQLSDLTVDGVSVDLGSQCRTREPSNLRMWPTGKKDYTPGSGGSLGAYDGLHAAAVIPLDSPYYFERKGMQIPDASGLDIAPFVGCGSGDDDLDPLVTAMASGPDNPVRVNQGPIVVHEQATIDLGDVDRCNVFGTDTLCPLPGPGIPDDLPTPD